MSANAIHASFFDFLFAQKRHANQNVLVPQGQEDDEKMEKIFMATFGEKAYFTGENQPDSIMTARRSNTL